jgi:hypothetical protein
MHRHTIEIDCLANGNLSVLKPIDIGRVHMNFVTAICESSREAMH